MRSPLRLAAAAAAVLTMLVTSVGGASAERRTAAQDDAELELLGHSPTVAQRGRLDITVDLGDTPADGSVEMVVHGRVRSRSELARSMEGEGLRSRVYGFTTPVSELPSAGGGVRVSLSLDPANPAGVSLTAAGVYPVELIARSADNAVTGRLMTHMLLEPPESDESPPLAVAVVAQLGAAPTFQPDGSTRYPSATLAGIGAVAGALAEAEAVATLQLAPELVQALSTGDDPDRATLVEQLRAAAARHAVAVVPYTEVSPDALAGAGLAGELARQVAAGSDALTAALGEPPDQATWFAGADLAGPGLALLAEAGFENVVLDNDQVEPLREGLISYSLAQPFLVGEGASALDAVVLDEGVLGHLKSQDPPALEVNRILAELAMVWFERPGVGRSLVVPVDGRTRPEVVAGLLAGLESGRVLAATRVDDAFDSASPLTQPGGSRVTRELTPDEPPRVSSAVRRDLPGALALQGTLAAMIGHDHPSAEPMRRHLLLAVSSELSPDDQRAHLEAASASVLAFADAITAPERQTITLTARQGTVPLTLANDSEIPVNVTVRLSSTKLSFPDGDMIPITLQPGATRIDISVEVLASGAFPLEVEVTSPDAALTLAETDYSIRSTAVSGVGVVLSAGAALFLVVWWARHWSRTRRSSKLVAATSDGSVESEDPADR